jgi:acyl-CoA hydrolase
MPEYKIGSDIGDSEEIAAHIIKLIPQNSTLQIGIGSISESVMSQLLQSNLESLRFAGMGCDPMSDMFDSGQLANNASDQNPAILSVELMGTRKIMNFAHENPLVSVVSSEVGHNSYHLGNIKNFISINSAIEIDLTGQINSETVGFRQISGVGGSLDFTEAATRSAGGISITALSSSAKNGTISRIVPNLAFGSAVTIPRSMSGIIVTERGVADMRGKSNSERASALIEICHPDHRNELINSVNQKRTL